MTTTIMKNSIVGDDWIRQMQTLVPPQKVMKDGVWTGDILSGPVRLSWITLDKLPAPSPQNQNPKFGATLLFPPPLPGWTKDQQMQIFNDEYWRVAAEKFAAFWNPAMSNYVGLHSPFHDQGEKFKYDGYTSGCVYFNASSQFKPPVVRSIPGDPNNFNPVINPAEVYPGVWAIVAMNTYASGLNAGPQAKKGPAFGIQSVLIIGEDTNIGAGKQADPKAAFGGVTPTGIPAPIQRPNLAALPPGMNPSQPSQQPPGIPPGMASHTPGTPQIITTTYRTAPPPSVPDDGDDYSFLA